MDNKIYEERGTAVTEAVGKDGVTSDSRRRFTKTGLGAGTVIATLVSKPVLGAQYYCTVSGMQSGNTSMHGPAVTCQGCSPGYWKNSPGSWSTYTSYTTSATFASVFGAPTYGTKTLMQVLTDEEGSLGCHIVGALLNASASDNGNMTYGYSAQEIINMYQASYMTNPDQLKKDISSLESPCPLPNDNSFNASPRKKP
ncbi:hypothetical protein ACFDAU_14245 [Sulfuriferula sp. GW1]|uniref:hypothetical protein n=1 Tax=Sulfuriferula sp. GW1 TaxID=3345111 RepID=UPI0039AFF908